MSEFDPTKPVRTRDGRNARILATDLKASEEHSVDTIAAAVDEGDYESVRTYRADGRYYGSQPDDDDLVNVPRKRTLYLNVYANGLGYSYSSAEHATQAAPRDRVASVKVEFEEGQRDF